MSKIKGIQVGNGSYDLGQKGVKRIESIEIFKTDRTETWYKVFGKKNKLIAEVNKNFVHLIWYK